LLLLGFNKCCNFFKFVGVKGCDLLVDSNNSLQYFAVRFLLKIAFLVYNLHLILNMLIQLVEGLGNSQGNDAVVFFGCLVEAVTAMASARAVGALFLQMIFHIAPPDFGNFASVTANNLIYALLAMTCFIRGLVGSVATIETFNDAVLAEFKNVLSKLRIGYRLLTAVFEGASKSCSFIQFVNHGVHGQKRFKRLLASATLSIFLSLARLADQLVAAVTVRGLDS
jgi:hypothetical protein